MLPLRAERQFGPHTASTYVSSATLQGMTDRRSRTRLFDSRLAGAQQAGPHSPCAAVAVGDHASVGADGRRGALGVERTARETGGRDDLDRRAAGSSLRDDARGERIGLPAADDAEITVRTRGQPV